MDRKYNSEKDVVSLVPAEYEVAGSEMLPDIGSVGVILRHKRSGARVALIANDDDNKLFCIGFRTPPSDDCGTPHIIEHTVLCGSKKYPVKDPFMLLVKGSLNTFLNAMTYPDKTIYPVSSCNDADFVNLMNVYLDAVFEPNIYRHKEIFMQEGWHYEPNPESGEIGINGVVYSEMKGATSSPDSNIYDEILYAMFPDNAYGRNSGGDPASIPNLEYEKYLDFHRKYYHPSNSYIMLYGNMDIGERLSYLDREYLSKYDKKEIQSEIGEQPSFGGVKEVTVPYPIGEGDSTDGLTYLAYSVRCAEATEHIDCFAWEFLDEVLLSSPGAPIKTALTEAGIGQEIYGGFLSLSTPVFMIIAKNTDKERADEFSKIIKKTLSDIVKNGVNKKSLLAAIERSEFRLREGPQSTYSRGLDLYTGMQSWLYTDEDPFRYLRLTEVFRELRRLADTDYYENLISRLIDPDHGVLLSLVPEPGLNEKNAAALASMLKEKRDKMSSVEFESLCAEFEEFKAYQDRPDSEDALETIPSLERGDISPSPRPIMNREGESGGLHAVFHDISSNGITYLRFLFDISHIPMEDVPYVSLLTELYGEMDTSSHAYGDLIDEIKLSTGALDFDVTAVRKYGDRMSCRPYFSVSVRALNDKIGDACGLIREIIAETKLNSPSRVKEILAETVSDLQRSILYNGSKYASGRACAYFSPADAYNEAVDGIETYTTLKRWLETFDESGERICERLCQIASGIFRRAAALVSVASDSSMLKNDNDIDRAVRTVADCLADGNNPPAAVFTPLGRRNEGFMTSSQVQYVAEAGNLFDAGHKYGGALEILAAAINNDYLYPAIRTRGGAYGYSCRISGESGNVALSTYRDPCLRESLKVFGGTGDFIRSLAPNEKELTRYIIGAFSRVDAPLSPYLTATRSLMAYLSGRKYEDMQKTRDEMLSATADELRSLASLADDVLSQRNICVIGSESKIKECADLFDSTVKLS